MVFNLRLCSLPRQPDKRTVTPRIRYSLMTVASVLAPSRSTKLKLEQLIIKIIFLALTLISSRGRSDWLLSWTDTVLLSSAESVSGLDEPISCGQAIKRKVLMKR